MRGSTLSTRDLYNLELLPNGWKGGGTIIFEHMNVNVFNPHDNFSELTDAMGILQVMEVGVYNLVETHRDTTYPKFRRFISQKNKAKDKYAQIEYRSNLGDFF